MLHPTPDRLEAYVEGGLPDADRAVLESHVQDCPRCRADVEEWRGLFAALAELPRFEPSVGFAERVMAGVRVREPLWSRVLAVLGRLVPQSTFGWVLVAALVSLPVLATGGVAAWLLTRPGLSPEALWVFLSARSAEAAAVAWSWLGQSVLDSQAATLLARMLAGLAEAGTQRVASLASLFAVLMVISSWILYTNLIRPSTRERRYVSYSF